MNKMLTVGFGIIALLAVSRGGRLHITMRTSLFSVDVQYAVVGTIKQIGYYNPHCLLVMDIKDGQPIEAGEWRMEFGTPSMLQRAGIYRDTLKPGTQISVLMYPYYQGKNGFVTDVTLPDRQEVCGTPKQVNNDKGFVGTPDFKVDDTTAPAKKYIQNRFGRRLECVPRRSGRFGWLFCFNPWRRGKPGISFLPTVAGRDRASVRRHGLRYVGRIPVCPHWLHRLQIVLFVDL